MINLLLLAVYILAYGAMGSLMGLSAALWYRRRTVKLFKIFLFLIYLSVLFFLSGLRFGLEFFVGWGGPSMYTVFEVLERMALASLIYFLSATINYILGRGWTRIRLARVLLAVTVYLVSGLMSLFSGNAMIPGSLAVLAFLLIVLFVLVDASRSLPMVGDERTRVSLFLLFGVTFIYLPLAQVLPLIAPGQERVLFFAGSVYYLTLGVMAALYYISALSETREAGPVGENQFTDSCRQAGLTPRESQIAGLIAQGLTYKEIAAVLDISPNTVSNHVVTIYRKTGTRSKVEMVNALRKF
ncbi:MAG: helix-turn-helix transcriptional regulator [Spirochaetaceae bacterium]|nr:helix-turn-helix transcriptional regulator [Spirochaetaceae bacterium]